MREHGPFPRLIVCAIMHFSPNDFVHPDDKAALEQLEAIPGFATAVKAFLGFFDETLTHGINMASKIRLGPKQLPKIHRYLPPICEKLGIEEPEFYLELNPQPNAYTFGDTQASITVTSGLLQSLDRDEFQAVLAHECGHVVCRHVLYHTMARMLMGGASYFGPLAALVSPIRYAMLYWSRRSEFSADRAAAVVLGDSKPVIETMIRLSGGPKTITAGVNIEQYIAQANDFDQLISTSTWDKILQSFAISEQDHPFPAVRAKEIQRWCQTGEFQRLRAAALSDEQMPKASSINPSSGECLQCKGTLVAEWKFCTTCGTQVTDRLTRIHETVVV